MTKDDDKTFLKITNRDIYEKLEAIDKKLDYTNGTVKFHTKLIWGSYGFGMAVLSWLIVHINNK